MVWIAPRVTGQHVLAREMHPLLLPFRKARVTAGAAGRPGNKVVTFGLLALGQASIDERTWLSCMKVSA